MCLKHTKVYEQVSSHGLACTDSRNTPKNTVFSKDAHAGVCAGLAIAAAPAFLERAVGEQQSIHYTDAAELRPSKISPPQNVSKNEGSLATIQETAISSAWNHIFHIQQRGPPRRSARKLLSRWHTRRSASRSPCLPWQPMDQPKNSELEHNYAISLRTN